MAKDRCCVLGDCGEDGCRGWQMAHKDSHFAMVRPGIMVYEAGADAMLREIWKMAKESPTGTFTFDTHVINCPSVFKGVT